MIKTRIFPESNCKSIYFNGKTLRLFIDPEKPVTELEYPEFYDIKLTNRCNGKCSFCYQDSIEYDVDYEAVDTLNKFFSSMTENQKPFQIAYGGGEPSLHYQFSEVMKMTREHDISPNYTSNGMFIETDKAEEIIETTKKYCEGVAFSAHPHLERYWRKAVDRFVEEGIFTNFHNIISDKNSVDTFLKIYKEYTKKVKYFVVLPMIEHGRAKNVENNFNYFFNKIKELKHDQGDINDIAFGANFYLYLLEHSDLKISLYEPEILSKYIDLKDGMMYPSSFSVDKPIRKVL